MGWEISRRAVLSSLATFVPAANATPLFSLKVQDRDIVLSLGAETVWRVGGAEIVAALGPTIELAEPAPNKIEIKNGLLLDDTACSLDLALSGPSPEVSFTIKLGDKFRVPLGRMQAARMKLQSDAEHWLVQSGAAWAATEPLREALGNSQLSFATAPRLAVDQKLRIHLVDPNGIGFRPAFTAFDKLRLLPSGGDPQSEYGRPLAVAFDHPLRRPQVFRIGSWRDTALLVVAPANAGETLIVRPLNQGTRSIVWEASQDSELQGAALVVRSESGSEGLFPGAAGSRMVRSLSPSGEARTELFWVLPTKPFTLHTGHGRAVVRGIEKHTIGPDRMVPVPVSVRARAVGDRLERFEATGVLSSFGVKLPGADLGRLDFDDEKCAFRIADCPGATAASIIHLTPLQTRGATSVELSLDKARLRVLRALDHLSLTFKFQKVWLEVGARTARLVPRGAEAVLIAELPPQHIAEQAFARQLPFLPGPLKDLPVGDLAVAHNWTNERRREIRALIEKSADGIVGQDFAQFSVAFDSAIKQGKIAVLTDTGEVRATRPLNVSLPPGAETLPDAVWLGPQFIQTIWARRLAREVASALADFGTTKAPLPDLESVPDLFGRLVVAWDVLHREYRARSSVDSAFPNIAVAAVLKEAERSSDEQRVLQEVYRKWRAKNGVGRPEAFITKRTLGQLTEWLSRQSDEVSDESKAIKALVEKAGVIPEGGDAEAIRAAYWEEQKRLGADELSSSLPVLARLSGFSRLAFSFKTLDPVAFSTDKLCDWDDLALKVAVRAKVFPSSRDPRTVADALKERNLRAGSDTADRLSAIIDATQPPDDGHTAIEVPSRLILSPGETARFRVYPRRSAGSGKPQPLWRAVLEEQGPTSTLRAIWSPDFWLRNAFPPPAERPCEPPRGPWAPWSLKRDCDVPAGSARVFRTSLDAFDRHQLVGLTSVFGMPVIPRMAPDGRTLHPTQLPPPEQYRLATGLFVDPKEGGISDARDQAIYLPQSLDGPRIGTEKDGERPRPYLALSAGGGFLDVDTTFSPPASLRKGDGSNLFNAFSLGRWQHQIVQGGDVFAEVAYVGFLMPTAHQATLVKLSERVNLLPTSSSVPISYLVQRQFIRVHPEKIYNPTDAPGMPFACRAWPATKITMRGSLRTPDLVDPAADRPNRKSNAVRPGGRIDMEGSTGLVFWPRTARDLENFVSFSFSIDEGQDVVSMPMIFVDNQAAHDYATMRSLYAYYNGLALSAPNPAVSSEPPKFVAGEKLRVLEHRGASRRYAQSRKPRDTTLETLRWVVGVDCRNGFRGEDEGFVAGPVPVKTDFMMDTTLESSDQPPFYPRLEKATVRLQMISRLAQTAQPESAFRYHPEFLEKGFTELDPDKARINLIGDTYFQSVGARPFLDMAGQGDRAGGVGRPAQRIIGLSRTGPVGNSEPARPQKFETARTFSPTYFSPNAKLLGLVSLQDLVGFALKHAASSAPLLREHIAYAATGTFMTVVDSLHQAVSKLHEEIAKVQVVYASAFAAADRLKTALEKAQALAKSEREAIAAGRPPDSAIEIFTEIAAAANDAKAEFEAISAAPLRRLDEAVQQQIIGLPLVLRGEVSKLPALIGQVPAGPFRRFMPLTLNKLVDGAIEKIGTALVARGQSTSAVEARLTTLRDKLDPAKNLELVKAFDAALLEAAFAAPGTLVEMRRQVGEAFGARIRSIKDSLLSAPLDPLPYSTVHYLVEFVTGSAAAVVPAGLDQLYADFVPAVARGKVDRLGAFIGKLIGQLSGDACNDATKVFEGLRAFILPRGLTSTNCALSDRCDVAPDAENLCNLLWKAYCIPYRTSGAAKANFDSASKRLAERFEALVTLFSRLPAANICDAKFLDHWVTLQTSRNAFSSELADWVESAVVLLNAPNTLPSPTAKDQLAAALARAAAAAIDVVAPDIIQQPVPNNNLAQLHRTLRRAREALSDRAISERKFQESVLELKSQLDELSAAAQSAITEQTQAFILASASEFAAVVPLIARGLTRWYDAVSAARDSLVARVPPAWKMADSLRLPIGKELQDERHLIAAMSEAIGPNDQLSRLRAFLAKVQENGGFAPIRLLEQVEKDFTRYAKEAAAAELVKLIDVGEYRKQLEKLAEQVTPLKRLLNYEYKLPLHKTDLQIITFRPKTGAVLNLKSKTEVDIKNGAVKSEFSGSTDSFFLDIGSGGEFLTLNFGEFTFSGGTGQGTKFGAPLKGVRIGPKMAFLAALAAFMGGGGSSTAPDGKPRNGPYVVRRAAGPGIIAGFRLGFDVFTIGAMGFANVFFDAHCELPFDAADSVVRLSLSSREAPMTIFYGIYGGSAHFQVEGDRKGTRRIDISLEFGGAQAISFGPLKGIGRVMTGIRVTRNGSSGTLSAIFTADFVGHVACFGIAACFSLSMSQGEGGISGIAVLTYTFSCGPARVRFRITVFRRQANAGSKEASLSPLFQQPRVMLAQSGELAPVRRPVTGSSFTSAVSPYHDWKDSRAYYSTFKNAVGSRRRQG